MAALVQVFGVEQGDKLWVCAVVVQHKVHHLLQCQQRLAHIQCQLSLSVIHALVNGFQHFNEQAFLAAEVVVNHPVIRLGQARNFFHAATFIAVLCKHLDGRAQDALAGLLRAVLAHACAAFARWLGQAGFGLACGGDHGELLVDESVGVSLGGDGWVRGHVPPRLVKTRVPGAARTPGRPLGKPCLRGKKGCAILVFHVAITTFWCGECYTNCGWCATAHRRPLTNKTGDDGTLENRRLAQHRSARRA